MGWTCTLATRHGAWDDRADNTRGDDAQTLEQAGPMRAQHPQVNVTRPARAHIVNTSAVTTHDERRRIGHTRRYPRIGV
jgi:hypothetical protein